MSQIDPNVQRIYGGNPSGDPSVQQPFSPSNQGVTETLVVGTYRRSVIGPLDVGTMSIESIVDSAGGAASTMNFWVSNVPNPSLANDNDWVLLATPAAVDLTVGGTKMSILTLTPVLWVMCKVVVAVSSCNLRVFAVGQGMREGYH